MEIIWVTILSTVANKDREGLSEEGEGEQQGAVAAEGVATPGVLLERETVH